MNINARLDRLIVRLCYVRNLVSTFGQEIDFDIDLHPVEAEVNSLYESALSQSEEIDNEPSGD